VGGKIHSGLNQNIAVVGKEGEWICLQLCRKEAGRKGEGAEAEIEVIEKGQIARKDLKIWVRKKRK